MSVSVPPERAEFVDGYRARHGVRTKSEVIDRALLLLQERELEVQYGEAFREWDEAAEARAWDVAAGDDLA